MPEQALPATWANRAERRKRAAAKAREIAASYEPSPCGCIGCNPNRHARHDFQRIAKQLNGWNGITDTDIYIAWRELHRGPGYF